MVCTKCYRTTQISDGVYSVIFDIKSIIRSLEKLYFLVHYQVSVCIILCVSQRLRLQTVSKIHFQMACYSYYWVLSTNAWIFWKIVVFFYPFWPFVHMKNNILGH